MDVECLPQLPLHLIVRDGLSLNTVLTDSGRLLGQRVERTEPIQTVTVPTGPEWAIAGASGD